MANIQFTVDTAKVTTAAGQVEQQMNSLEATAKELVAAIEALKGAKWTGNAQKKVQAKCTDFKKGINIMKRRLTEEVRELRQTAARYEKSETINVSTANSNLGGNVVR